MGDPVSGGFVELDNERLNRDELVLLGMKMAMDECVTECQSQAAGMGNPVASSILNAWADRMAERRDNLAVILTRSALRTKNGRFTALKGDN